MTPDDRNQVLLLGVAFDAKSSFASGAAGAPPQIRAALSSGHWHCQAESGPQVGPEHYKDLGDFAGETLEEIYRHVRSHLMPATRLLALGGDHSVTIALIRAHAEVHGPLTVVYVDAHPDLYEDYDNDRESHACVCARILEAGWVDRLIQIGVRTLNEHQRTQAKRLKVEIRNIDGNGDEAICLTSEAAPLRAPVYISLDLDAVDPAFAPGVSHREPGGLTPRDIIRLIHRLPVRPIGADLVELNPLRDPIGLSALVAAKFARELLAVLS